MCSHGNVYARVSLVAQIPGFPGNESGCKAGDLGSVPELGRSPGEGNHYPLQYSGLEKSMDRGVWQGFQRVGPWGPWGPKDSDMTEQLHFHFQPSGLAGKESACNAGDTGDSGSIPGSGRSPGGGHGNPLQYSWLADRKTHV